MSVTDDDPGATLDDELVECPPCNGTGKGTTDDFVLGNGCIYCSGLGRVTTTRAVAWIDATKTT